MSTRGEYGFIINGVRKTTYNHSDSYPSGLGDDFVNWLKTKSVGELKEIANRVEMVSEFTETPENIVDYVQQFERDNSVNIIDLRVGNCSINDPYCVFRKAQGNFKLFDMGFKYMLEGASNEFSYICDLDKEVFILSVCGKEKASIPLEVIFTLNITFDEYIEKNLIELY